MSSSQPASRWRFLISPKWLGWHLFVLVAVLGMLALGDWQLHRAESGNALSWAYTFEWPLFAGFAVVFWVKTIRDEVRPPVPPEPATNVDLPTSTVMRGVDAMQDKLSAVAAGEEEDEQEDADLAAYNAYLARLTKEVKGHGKWHGFR